MNPATEGKRWLVAEHMEDVIMQRIPQESHVEIGPLDKVEEVSVNLRTCCTAYVEFGMVQAVESVFNSLGQSKTIPLIIDSGASCCISPRREDFVTYSDSKVKIKDLSGINKVAGEGLIEWKVVDKLGREQTIVIKGYHVPRASVRLISPHCVYQSIKGSDGRQNDKEYIMMLNNGSVLIAPYGPANLPLLQLSTL
jgi:hypothetical protein